MRSLVNYCLDLRFQRPRVEQITGQLMSMCYKEGLKIQAPALQAIIRGCNQDVRQVSCTQLFLVPLALLRFTLQTFDFGRIFFNRFVDVQYALCS